MHQHWGSARMLTIAFLGQVVTGCSQPLPHKDRFVTGSRTRGVQGILKTYRCPHPHKSELGDGTHGAEPLRVILHIGSFVNNNKNGHLTYV